MITADINVETIAGVFLYKLPDDYVLPELRIMEPEKVCKMDLSQQVQLFFDFRYHISCLDADPGAMNLSVFLGASDI